jgi:NADPH2:quinone reductase
MQASKELWELVLLLVRTDKESFEGGDPEFVNPRMLMDTSRTLTGGDLWSYLTSKEERIKRATQLFEWVTSKKISVSEPTKFKLSEGKQAHDFLEGRKSTGKIILIP